MSAAGSRCTSMVIMPVWTPEHSAGFGPRIKGIVRNRNPETGIRGQETGTRRQEPGDRNQETGIRRQESGKTKDKSQNANSINCLLSGSCFLSSTDFCFLIPDPCLLTPDP